MSFILSSRASAFKPELMISKSSFVNILGTSPEFNKLLTSSKNPSYNICVSENENAIYLFSIPTKHIILNKSSLNSFFP